MCHRQPPLSTLGSPSGRWSRRAPVRYGPVDNSDALLSCRPKDEIQSLHRRQWHWISVSRLKCIPSTEEPIRAEQPPIEFTKPFVEFEAPSEPFLERALAIWRSETEYRCNLVVVNRKARVYRRGQLRDEEIGRAHV